ncbi:MAG: ATPase, partial [Pedobacter sp.]
MELGPSGYPFEKYFAAILQHIGYSLRTGVILQGACVKHEVDVIAEKENQHEMVECKFHQQQGTFCDVKIPLYIHARFKDVEAGFTDRSPKNNTLHQGWVVTNTRFTTDAIHYGTCAGLKLIGWN